MQKYTKSGNPVVLDAWITTFRLKQLQTDIYSGNEGGRLGGMLDCGGREGGRKAGGYARLREREGERERESGEREREREKRERERGVEREREGGEREGGREREGEG